MDQSAPAEESDPRNKFERLMSAIHGDPHFQRIESRDELPLPPPPLRTASDDPAPRRTTKRAPPLLRTLPSRTTRTTIPPPPQTIPLKAPLLPQTMPLVINAGDNLELDPSNITLPYQHIKMLGHGGCASVEMVRDVNTGSVYARKVFKHVTQRNLRVAKEDLRNEVQIMQRLSSHRHIIKVHATYIMNRELGIILSPVADGGDLQSFLQDFRDNAYSTSSIQYKILIKAFGCLASGLAFIHQQTIRHKDIKPSNILIHRGQVLYTDFGLSYDFSTAGQSTTTGLSSGHTKRYCAPEVADLRPRNSKSDVFSLGCVFLEMYQTSHRMFPEFLFDKNFQETLKLHSGEVLFVDEWGKYALKDLFRAMVQLDPTKRPTSHGLTSYLHSINLNYALLHIFCKECYEDLTSEDINTSGNIALPPQSTSEPLWKLVNDSIQACTRLRLLRETVTPRQVAQWVADNHLEFLLSQRLHTADWNKFYKGKFNYNDAYSWKKEKN